MTQTRDDELEASGELPLDVPVDSYNNNSDGVIVVEPGVRSVSPQEEENPLLLEKAVAHAEDANKYPSSMKFIISNEICERFSYYGLRAILVLYLKQPRPDGLGFSPDAATVIYHAFIMAAYATTLLGGFLSDAVLGKYNTILYLSMIYCVGSVTLAVTAIPGVTGSPPHWWGVILGLSLVALGTGGIKPVVSAFLGDQFAANQAHLLTRVFAIFYFSINLGSVFSTLITPFVRSRFGYPYAFGLPAVLLVVALFVFWSGKSRYRTHSPQGSVLVDSVKIISRALVNLVRHGRRSLPRGKSWLYLAEGPFSNATIREVSLALSVLLIFVPLPFFWAIFDQHGSRWILQAEMMDLKIWKWTLQPDQIPAFNPMLVLILVPIFDVGIYPLVGKMVRFRPLPRMAVGMFLAGSSFIAAAYLETVVDDNPPNTVHILWQFPQYLLLTCGEVMLSITGLEFAYTQAPKSMKSLIMAGWQLTVAVGNLIVLILADTLPLVMWKQYVLFAFLMFAMIIIFGVISWRYKYADEIAAKDSE